MTKTTAEINIKLKYIFFKYKYFLFYLNENEKLLHIESVKYQNYN